MKQINLNIMFSYPVHWSKQEVFRDLIQNFYDDAGAEQFGELFKHIYTPAENDAANCGNLKLYMKSKGFSYEWLLYIGASTKQEDPGKYAGFYGEGFKMAVLCALRDYHWGISVCSQNWSLKVITTESFINNKRLLQLAYELEEREMSFNETTLTISNIKQEDVGLFEDTVQTFYYPANPLFGELIFKNDYTAIYKRSGVQKPKSFPFTFECDGDGIMFLCFQARGSFYLPVVLCNHRFKTEDRERKQIYLGTVQDVILDMVDSINIKAALFLLEQLEKYWYDYPDTHSDTDSWYSVVGKLVRKIQFDDNAISDFRSKYPNLAVCEKATNFHMRNQKKQALAWKKLYMPDTRLVQDRFYLFNYQSIVTLCDKSGGFNNTRLPTKRENKPLAILRETANRILAGFILNFPPCFIIENNTSVYSGTASTRRAETIKINSKGYRVRYDLVRIEIKKSLLVHDGFSDAFSTYCHELCHCFGTDASQSFSSALTEVMALMIKNQHTLKKAKVKWGQCFASGKQG